MKMTGKKGDHKQTDWEVAHAEKYCLRVALTSSRVSSVWKQNLFARFEQDNAAQIWSIKASLFG